MRALAETWIRTWHRLTTDKPVIPLLLVLIALGAAAVYATQFRLDASADSLVLESDKDLDYYGEVRDQYGSDDFLVVTFQPDAPLFSDASINTLTALRDDLAGVPAASSITSVLDVPLLQSPPVSFTEIQNDPRTLLDDDVDRSLAAKEFANSPLYRNLLTDPEATVTALLVNLKPNAAFAKAAERRDTLRRQARNGELDDPAKLAQAETAYSAASAEAQDASAQTVADVRAVLDRYRDAGTLRLGGVSMIASDMIDFVEADISLFGVIVGILLIVLLGIAFRRVRWVVVPTLICGAVILGMVGLLGFTGWPVTVVSSNFVALMLIITLSLVVHLVVRHMELHAQDPSADQKTLIRGTINSKFAPCVYTALTTMVSFGSLIIADVRPVIDFGTMMVAGVVLAFVLTFLLYPGLLGWLGAGKPSMSKTDVTASITRALARLVERAGGPLLVFYAALAVFAVVGILRLGVENRFIDYFKPSTEIYQGMVLIDKKLGGTTPLEVIINAPESFTNPPEPEAEADDAGGGDDFDDLGIDFDALDDSAGGLTATSYWYNSYELERIGNIHDYLDGLPETGKVLSLDTTMDVMQILNDGDQLDDLTMAVIYNAVPPSIKSQLFDPYLSADGNQLRYSIRVIDSDKNLNRDDLLKKIRADLIGQFDLQPEQVKITGLLVLYNNVLQSLFKSQILTLGTVFIVIGIMLALLFRSLKLAIVGILPTAVAAASILGLMGWLGIPLDIMTITIAAITIGIGVDNTIHYTHRYMDEVKTEGNTPLGDRWAAMHAAHGSVGRAIFYTSVVVTLGFSILGLSNFVPIVYFGLFTGMAMVLALLANLTLLPLLLVKLKLGT